MATFDADMADMLGTVRDQFGRGITIERIARGAMNTTTGARAETPTQQSVTGHALPVLQTPGSGRATSIETARYMVVYSDLSWTPREGDVVVDSGVRRRIIGVSQQCGGLEIVLDTEMEARNPA